MSMMGSIEKWPRYVHLHFFRHYKKGALITSAMPVGTFEQREERARLHMCFYHRLLRHMVKMHPEVFS